MQDQIYEAWRAFRRGKKPSPDIDNFEYHLAANLVSLTNDIAGGTYRHGSYRRVIIRERKRRDLAVAAVRDRVVHRLVYDKLVDLFDKSFDPDVWSCRCGKGLHKCLTRCQQLLGKYQNSYIWRMDITKFFDNVDHGVLKQCLRRRIKDKQLLWLCDEIISSYCHGGGGTL